MGSKKKAEKKPKAPKAPKPPKPKPSEKELVDRYVKKIMNAAVSTMVDRKDLHGITGKEFKKTATMIALDKDFYFSVVFQTSDQKYEFLKALAEKFGFKLETKDDEIVEMVNGVRLADSLGVALKKEPLHGFPVSDVQLLPFVLQEI